MDIIDSRKRNLSWKSSRSFDSHGNTIEYPYKQEDGKDLADEHSVLPSCEMNRLVADQSRQR